MANVTRCQNIKFVLVGDIFVGKTSLANVFVHDAFRDTYSASVGGHFMAKTLDEPKVTLQLWDTAGQERFRSMLPTFMRNALCAIIIYDVSNRESFLAVRDYWIDYVQTTGSENLVKVLVGNKMDISDRAVQTKEGQRLAQQHGMMFTETSAKLKLNVHQLFVDAATTVIKTIPEDVERTTGLRLEHLGHPSQSSCCLSRKS